MKKAAIQLSVNFLVMLIISLVVFGMGIVIMNKFFGEAEGKVLVWNKRSEQEIENLLDDGARVAVPFDHKVIGNKKMDTFGVGILSVIDQPSTEFEITVEFSKAFQGSQLLCDAITIPCKVDPNTWLRSSTQSVGPLVYNKDIKKYDQEKFLIGVDVEGAEFGTYLFDLNVYVKQDRLDPSAVDYDLDGSIEDLEQYDNPIKLIVDVK